MLWLRATNTFTDPKDVAQYTVSVGIGDKPIWNGHVRGHYRPNGAAALLRKIADEMENVERA